MSEHKVTLQEAQYVMQFLNGIVQGVRGMMDAMVDLNVRMRQHKEPGVVAMHEIMKLNLIDAFNIGRRSMSRLIAAAIEHYNDEILAAQLRSMMPDISGAEAWEQAEARSFGCETPTHEGNETVN